MEVALIVLVMAFIVWLVLAIHAVSRAVSNAEKESAKKESVAASTQRVPAELNSLESDMPPVSRYVSQDLDGYKLIASSITSAVSNLLAPFRLAAALIGESPKSFDEIQFFTGFLQYSSSFTEEICVSLAKGIRQLSSVPEVRGTPTTSLARRIRLESFEKLDSVLNQYAQVLNILGVEYSRSSVSGSAITGAVVGKILGGSEEGSNEFAVLGGLVGAIGEFSSKAVIKSHAELAAYVAIRQYLDLVAAMPESLLDSGSTLIYGGNVDFNRQAAALASIQDSISRKVRSCSEMAGLMPQVKASQTKALREGPVAASMVILSSMCVLGLGIIILSFAIQRDFDISFLLIGLGFLSVAVFFFVLGLRAIRTRKSEPVGALILHIRKLSNSL
jgi:hypothetical protein